MVFWCKGKKDYCDKEFCMECEFEDGSGGVELEDDDAEGIFIRKWISVKDMLPPFSVKVLVVNGHGYINIYGFWDKVGDKWTWLDSTGHYNHVNDITHWMPLPEQPKEG